MAKKVKLILNITFVADTDVAIRSGLLRLRNDIKTSLQFGKIPGLPTGIKDVEVSIEETEIK